MIATVIWLAVLFVLTLNTGIIEWRKNGPFLMRQMKPEEKLRNRLLNIVVYGFFKAMCKLDYRPNSYWGNAEAFCQDWGWWGSLEAQENERLEAEILLGYEEPENPPCGRDWRFWDCSECCEISECCAYGALADLAE